jgi:hypothetical protein
VKVSAALARAAAKSRAGCRFSMRQTAALTRRANRPFNEFCAEPSDALSRHADSFRHFRRRRGNAAVILAIGKVKDQADN